MNPFTSQPDLSVSHHGESQLIEQMRNWLGDATPPSPHGIGDDCAILSNGKGSHQAITIDPIIYGVHFDDSVAPSEAAAKLIKRNASDIAAMGATPTVAVLSLTLPETTRTKWLEMFYRGLATTALKLDLKIVGGDLTNGGDSHLSAHLCMVGELEKGTQPLLRKQGQSGDRIFVTGELGGSRLEKHYSFSPRISEGKWLATKGVATACLDISDGLGKDARQLVADNATAEIDVTLLPISQAALQTANESGNSAIYHAINDGEDYELLFTTPKEKAEALMSYWAQNFDTRLSCIGKIVNASTSNYTPVNFLNHSDTSTAKGYEHL